MFANIKIVYKSVMERIRSNQMGEDLFFKRQLKNIPTKIEVNNTPIRQRDNTNKENNGFPNNKPKDWNKQHAEQTEKDITPNSVFNQNSVANSRTIPKRRVSVQSKGCVNHLDAEADFRIEIDGQSLNYCNKCATHLASNGFQVQRINSSRSPRRVKDMGRSPFSKRKQQLTSFIQTLKQLEQDYMKKEQLIRKVQGSHQIQKQTITNFYSSMFQYLQYIRDEHIHFLQEEANRNTQICQIEAAEIAETLEEVKGMREDIETNVNKIVEEVEEDSYTECMGYYQQKKGVHEHRLEQLGNDARPANCTTAECIQQKLGEFKDFIDELTGILGSKAEMMDY